MTDQRTPDPDFAPGSWTEVTRLTGWSPGAPTRSTPDEIEQLKKLIRFNDHIRKLRELMLKDRGQQ